MSQLCASLRSSKANTDRKPGGTPEIKRAGAFETKRALPQLLITLKVVSNLHFDVRIRL